MNRNHLLALSGITLFVAACGLIEVQIRSAPIIVTIDQQTRAAGGCDNRMGVGEVSIEDMTKGADVDIENACIKSIQFSIEVSSIELDVPAGSTCGESPTGTVTPKEYTLDFQCQDGSTATLNPPVVCDGQNEAIAVDGSGENVERFKARVNDCLNKVEARGEELRTLLNNCRPKKANFTALGECSADACFALKTVAKFSISDGKAASGSCPSE